MKSVKTTKSRRAVRLGSTVAILAALLLAGCGSEESKLERGAVVGKEVASPESKDEMKMTEEERQAMQVREEEAAEDAEWADKDKKKEVEKEMAEMADE